MNNKGFAITALLYGLSIIILMTVVLMMSVMQNSRKNTHTLVKSVEEGLDAQSVTSTDKNGANFTIPDGQSGYYRIEMCYGGTLYSGSVFLRGRETIIHETSPNYAVKIDGNLVMNASNQYINGSAKSFNGSNNRNYPIINSQIITGSACTNGFHMNKVSVDIPFESVPEFDGKTSINAPNAKKITVVFYNVNQNPDRRIEHPGGKSVSGSSISWSGAQKISEIYIEYENTNVVANGISINGTTISTGGQHKVKGNVIISRFGPYGSTIKPGNYVISQLKKTDLAPPASQEDDIHDYIYEFDQSTVLSTSTYTPTSKPATTDTNLIFYGHESMARPVITSKYASLNSQKWRFEKAAKDPSTNQDYASNANVFRISEVDEYKTFEVHKQDSSEDEEGPILVCGEYVWDDTLPAGSKFKSTDNYTGNQNQQWQIESAGAGTFRFVTNKDVEPKMKRYLNCEDIGDPKGDGKNNRCYITTTVVEASVFQIFNVDI